MIELKHLGKIYSSASGSVEALKDVNLTIADGEIFGIIGLSGAGKSPLVRCINLLERPTSGEVWVDGQNLTALSEKALLQVRRQIGMIFQSFNLLEQRSVLRNVCFPLEISGTPKAEAKKRAEELLKVVGLADKAASFPSQLSGGQKQRVAIARALATNPRYLLCDEATSALDPNTTRSILELLREINKTLGVTIIVITHEMKVIDQICDRVAVIDKSCIAEEGRVADVFTNPKSDIARELVLPQERPVLDPTTGGRKLRLIFNGEDTQKPVISEMILACRVPVNVLFADTKSVEGAAYGHMILELPTDEHDAEKVVSWLKNSGLTWKEERELATEYFVKLWDNNIIQLGIWQTVYMTALTTIFAYLIGLPLGVILWATDKDGLHPNKGVNTVLGFIVNFFRSIPAVILMVAMIPAAKLLLGTSTGNGAVIVTLIIAAAPYVARMVESSLKEVPAGVIEAAQAMGCTNLQIIWHVLLPEAKPSLISGCVISTVTILSYTALAATLGGTGLGQIAIIHGHQRSQKLVVWVCVLLIVVIVQLIQIVGTTVVRKTDKRAR